jgi:hypothetical protein
MITKDTRYNQKGSYFEPLKVAVRESFSQYYSEIIMEVITPLSTLEPVYVGEVPFLVRDYMKGDQGVQYVLMPEVWSKSGALGNSWQGPISVNRIINKQGFQVEGDTSDVYMTMASVTTRQLINYLKESGASGGRGLFATLTATGKLKVLSPQLVLSGDSITEVLGQITEQKYSLDWIQSTPGLVHLIFYTDKGIEEEMLKITSVKHPVPITHYYHSAFLHDEQEKEAIRNRYRNVYWYNYYTTYTVKVTNTQVLDLGAVVTYANDKYLVWEVETSFTGGSLTCNTILVKGPNKD